MSQSTPEPVCAQTFSDSTIELVYEPRPCRTDDRAEQDRRVELYTRHLIAPHVIKPCHLNFGEVDQPKPAPATIDATRVTGNQQADRLRLLVADTDTASRNT